MRYRDPMDDAARRARLARRDAALAEAPGYRPVRHLAFVTLFAVAVALLCVAGLRSVTPSEWLALPLMATLANAAEWAFHRRLLHRRRPPFHWVYDAHNRHHAYFVDGDMAIRGRQEWRLILLPWWSIVALAVALLPLLGLLALVSANAARIVLATSMIYVALYELLHLAFHLPDAHPLRRWGVMRWLARHHELHHDPRLMRDYNFNVIVPLWDHVRGTVADDR